MSLGGRVMRSWVCCLRWAGGRLLVVLLGAGCGGCSFVFVNGPPSESASEPLASPSRCTTSVLQPVGDTLNAGIGAINIGVAASAGRGDVTWYGVRMDAGTGLALGLAQLGLFGASAVYGYVQTSRCRSYLAAVEERTPSWNPVRAAPPPRAASPSSRGTAPRPPVPSASSSTSAPPPPSPAPEPTPTAAAPAPAPAVPAPAPSPSVPTAAFPPE